MSRRPHPLDPYTPGRGATGYAVDAYDLRLDYRISSNHLDGRARIRLTALEPLATISFDLVGLQVTAATAGGARARWHHRRDKVAVTPATPLKVGDEVVVELRYRGGPGMTGSTWGTVGWEELDDGVLVSAQPTGASTWFPCNDLAAQKAPFTVSITTPSPYFALVNGALQSTRTRGSTTTRVYEQSEPTSPYLMTVNIGRYIQRTIVDEPVTVRAVLDPGDLRSFSRAFARQAEMVETFVELFGPYPFAAGYTVVVCPDPLEIPLEAQGQSIFGRNHLDGRHERLIAHELAHQWFGNSLTAATWRDIWLHEGFACYAEWLWSERSGGPSADDLARKHHARLRGLPQDLLLADPGPEDMFDDRVYKRGALTLHAFRLRLGDERFFDLLRRWTATGRHGVVTTAEFEDLAGAGDDASLRGLFDAWLHAAPLPELPPDA